MCLGGMGLFLQKEVVGLVGLTQTWGHPVSGWFVYFYPLGKTVQQELFSRSLISCVVFYS